MSTNHEKKVIKNFFDDTPITKLHLEIMIIIAIAYVFEQADNFNFTYIAPALRESWGLSVQDIGKINTWFSVGMLIGSFIFGMVSDRFGRKKALIIASCCFSTFSLLNGFAPNLAIFTAMRFMTGIGLCGIIVVTPTYLVEFLPIKNRGRLYSITLSCGYLGIPLIAIICNIIIPMGDEHWRYVFILGSAGYLIALLAVLIGKESPRWLVSKGRVKEAEEIVGAVIGDDYVCDFGDIQVENRKLPTKDILKIVFSKRHIKETLALLGAQGLILPIGLVFVNNSATILLDRGFSMDQSLQLATLLSVGMLGGPIVASIIGDHGGRKWPIAISALLLSIISVIYGFVTNYYFLCALAFLFSVLVQVGTVMASNYGPELYPTKYRNAATGMVGTLGRVCAIFIMASFTVLYPILGASGIYVFLGIGTLLSAIIVALLGKKTGGVALENVSE